mgnify:CR=1 FL=1
MIELPKSPELIFLLTPSATLDGETLLGPRGERWGVIFAHHEIITKQYQQMYDKNEKERISFTQQHIQNKNKFQ